MRSLSAASYAVCVLHPLLIVQLALALSSVQLATHAPIEQNWLNRTGEACPERNEGTMPTRT